MHLNHSYQAAPRWFQWRLLLRPQHTKLLHLMILVRVRLALLAKHVDITTSCEHRRDPLFLICIPSRAGGGTNSAPTTSVGAPEDGLIRLDQKTAWAKWCAKGTGATL